MGIMRKIKWASLCLACMLIFHLFVNSHAGTIDKPFFRASSMVIVIGGSDFAENGGTSPVVVDFHLLDNTTSGQAAPDIINADGVGLKGLFYDSTPGSDGSLYDNEVMQITGQNGGGSLTNIAPFEVLDANDSMTAFGMDDNTDLTLSPYYRFTHFFVASNAAFDIYAHADNIVKTGDFATLDISYIRFFLYVYITSPGGWGASAQNPAIGGQGRVASIQNLGDLTTGPTKIFDGGRKTARLPGTLKQQAVNFIPVYYLVEPNSNQIYDFSFGTGSIGATVTYSIYTP